MNVGVRVIFVKKYFISLKLYLKVSNRTNNYYNFPNILYKFVIELPILTVNKLQFSENFNTFYVFGLLLNE